MSAFAATAARAELPVPCGGGACTANGGPAVWVSSGRVQAPAVVGNTMNITQESDKAILNWASFNVDAGTSINFAQPTNASVALNRIYQSDPSRIFGAVHANGQIYLVNQNGILFGAGTKVDVHGLVASTLDVSDGAFETGIAQVIKQSTPAPAFVSKGTMGAINIEQGAVIQTDDGGQVMIFAPGIVNAGTIHTPQGQTILAASQDKVYLQVNSTSDPTLRGFLVEVGSGGDVSNLGSIIAERGNATLMGLAVNQNGMISASTSVQLNGSIMLLARDQVKEDRLRDFVNKGVPVATHGGTVTLGESSVTQILPELDDIAAAVDDQSQPLSTVAMMGKTIHLKSGSKVVAPSGNVEMVATENPINADSSKIPRNDSRIQIDPQALIDVSGTTSTVLPMSRNVVEVELRGNELQDAPLQRDGILRGKKVRVDVRKGTSLANASGAYKNIKRSVGERLSAGGTVTAASEGDLILFQSAVVDFSGGSIRYKDGYLNTTKLYSKTDGKVVDITNADPNKQYSAVLGTYDRRHDKWGITESFQLPGGNPIGIYEQGYIEGKDAGSFNARAGNMLIDGNLRGKAVTGILQRLPSRPLTNSQPVWARRFDEIPWGGEVVLGNPSELSAVVADFRAPSVIFATDVAPTPVSIDERFPADKTVTLSQNIFADGGINRVSIYSNGRIVIPEDVTLSLAPGGKLALVAGTSSAPTNPDDPIAPALEINGKVTIPAGQVSLSSAATRAVGIDRELYQGVEVGPKAHIDVAGLWVNDSSLLNPGGAAGAALTDGGSVTAAAPGDLILSRGSLINTDGGAQILSDGTMKAGSAGNISLSSDADQVTTLRLEGDLHAYSLGKGGALSISADSIRIRSGAADGAEKQGELVLAPDLFQNAGFSSFDLEATKFGLTIDENTHLRLMAENRVLDAGFQNQVTGSDLGQFSHIERLLPQLRSPVDLSLRSRRGLNGDFDAGLYMKPGSVIEGDPGANISLRSDRMLTVAGTVDAPAGEISLRLDSGAQADGFYVDKAIWLTPAAHLSTPAYSLLLPNDLGFRQGIVLDAGSINIEAKEGSVVAVAGSELDVSGKAQTLDLPQVFPDGTSDFVPITVAASAGKVQITAADGLYLDSTLLADAAPVKGSRGGSLTVALESGTRSAETFLGGSGLYTPKGPRVMQLTDGIDASLPATLQAGDSFYSDDQLNSLHTQVINDVETIAHLSASRIQQAGFDSVDLRVRPVLSSSVSVQPTSDAKMAFDGDVSLQTGRRISLDTPVLSTVNGRVELSAPYVAIGFTDTGVRMSPVPTPGDGSLHVAANVIDLIGDTGLEGFGAGKEPAADLRATRDIRLRGVRLDLNQDALGSLSAAGDMAFDAGQIYPTTLSNFTLSSEVDPEAVISFTGGSAMSPPLSADGVLTVSAPHILQQGTLRAPFGQIVLNAGKSLELDGGSITSVSGAGLTVPFGETQFGRDWVVPFQSTLISVVNAPRDKFYSLPLPEKKVSLVAPTVNFTEGAVIDVSGGGDLYAHEFVPGPGGSKDILLPSNAAGAFAVLPALGSLYAPVDPVISMQGIQAGDTVYLDASSGLPAGEYTILPARYALLPGAFLVTPVPGTAGMTSAQNYTGVDGIPVIAGQRRVTDTDISASLWSGFAIENGDRVRQRAEYTESYANTFFNADGLVSAPPLPKDAGSVSINAGLALTLGGHVDGQTPGGRGSQVDIVGQQLSVTAEPNAGASGIQILASGINALGAQSVLLGGQRETTPDGISLNATANSIDIGAGVNLQAPELMMVAASGTDEHGDVLPGQITVESGAMLQGSGGLSGADNALLLDGDSALLRVSAGGEPSIRRTNLPSAPSAQLTVAAGAKLVAGNSGANGALQGGSLILDSAGDAASDGEIQVGDGGALRLGASRISIGDVPATAIDQGLLLSNDAFGQIGAANISLVSADSIDLYGNALVSAGNLTMQAQAINGYTAADQMATVQADTLNLIGSLEPPAAVNIDGVGSLEIKAKAINLGSIDGSSATSGENLFINGFEQVSLDAGEVGFQGMGSLQIMGAADITSGNISESSSSDWNVIATDAIKILNGVSSQASTHVPGLGAKLELVGSSVTFDGNVNLPSGQLTLKARGGEGTDNVTVGPLGVIDVSGTTVQFGEATVAIPGGQVILQSEKGDVQIQSGSKINVIGGNANAGGGSIGIAAPHGQVSIAGNLTATATSGSDTQGNFSLDAYSIPDFAALSTTLLQGGFTGKVDLRARSGDFAIGPAETIKAHNLTLTADGIAVDQNGDPMQDGGNIDISGTIDASGSQAGRVSINAGNDLTLHGSAIIDARGTDSNVKGGSVFLGTRQGSIVMYQGAAIDVTGTQRVDLEIQQQGVDAVGHAVQNMINRTDTGLVQFRMPRDSVATSDLTGANEGIKGAGATIMEAYQVYTDSTGVLGSSAVNASAGNPYYQDAVTFMQNQPDIMANMGLANETDIQLRPGIEIRSQGVLNVTSALDLSQWRFGPQGAPGVLTLRSADNLSINSGISDGFDGNAINPYTGAVADVLRHDDSWSLRTIAGAELSSADPLAVNPGVGQITLGTNVGVRTGTGNIDMAAGGDIVMGKQSVVYTAGIDGGLGTYDPLFAAFFLDGQYPLGGGDIHIAAGGSISAKPSSQLINSWSPRLGGAGDYGNLPTTWAINFQNFHQGIGALGGGNVNVVAGGSIDDLSVAMPTVGMQLGQAEYDLNSSKVTLETNDVIITGGNSLSVTAGGDIRGGVFYAGQGEATVRAGGSMGKSPADQLYPTFALGDGRFTVAATDDLGIETIFNPKILTQSKDQGVPGLLVPESFFFGYGPTSEVNLTSYSGDIHFSNEVSGLVQRAVDGGKIDPLLQNMLLVYPGILSAHAVQGNIVLGKNSFTLFPSSQGQLELLASDSITIENNQTPSINLSDADPSILPTADTPVNVLGDAAVRLNPHSPSDFNHAATPIHLDDGRPALIVARDGSIGPKGGTAARLDFYLAKTAHLIAGQDIRNTRLEVQNLNETDTSLVKAGRDVIFETGRSDNGSFDESVEREMRFSGPGNLEVVAGRNVDLGTSAGILTVGNTLNPALDPNGANILVVAGAAMASDYEAFTSKYLVDSNLYEDKLSNFLSKYSFDDPTWTEIKKFKSLPLDVRRELIFEILFEELKTSGTAATDVNGGSSKDYSRGYGAIETLFPGSVDGKNLTQHSSDLNMLLSRITTVDGGGINLVVPYGNINAGVADTSALAKAPEELGIVVQRSGDINSYVLGNFLVNQSRVFALDGGDIMMWSSLGDIDAGRGAKTAITAPPPLVAVDNKGQITLEFPPAIAGSGIRGAVTTPGKPPGDVFLFAPKGVVNAGDAGIGSAGNVTIGAVEVRGADNINIGGVAVGVPMADTSSLAAGLTSVGNVTSNVTKSTENSLDSMSAKQASETPLADAALTYLDVVVFGLGDETVGNKSLNDTSSGN